MTSTGHFLQTSSRGATVSRWAEPTHVAERHRGPGSYPRVAIGAGGGAIMYFTPIEKMLTLPLELPV